MHANMFQQYGGYNFLSSYYTQNQAGNQRAESPDEEVILVPGSSPETSPLSSGYGSLLETSRASPDGSQSRHSNVADYLSRIPHQYGARTEPSDYIQAGRVDGDACDTQNDSRDQTHQPRSSDTPSLTDSSLSTQDSPSSNGSSNSPSGSTKSSPSSSETVKTPEVTSKPAKKNARTAYTNEQIQTLLKIFHENPYPDSEHMERIAMDFGVAENKIKIWFQNKRARWRRRVNNNTPAYPQQFVPTMSPMLSPVGQYGYMPSGPYMTSSPLMMPGYLNYAAMQAPMSTNTTMNSTNSRLQSTYSPMTSISPPMTSKAQYPTSTSYQQMSSAPYTRMSPPSTSLSTNYSYLPHS